MVEERGVIATLIHVLSRWLIDVHVGHCLCSLVCGCLLLFLLNLSILLYFLKMLEHVLVVKNSVREFIHKGSASKEPFDATLKHRHLEKLMDVGPFSWISFKHHLEDVSYGRGEMRGKWRVLALDNFLGKLVERARIKGRCQGRHLVKEHSERPDVRLETVALTLNDLWGEIVGSSYHSLCFGARI